jgi:hypothetical protein
MDDSRIPAPKTTSRPVFKRHTPPDVPRRLARWTATRSRMRAATGDGKDMFNKGLTAQSRLFRVRPGILARDTKKEPRKAALRS